MTKPNGSRRPGTASGSETAVARRTSRWRAIDAGLREAYGEILNEPVPDALRAALPEAGPQSATKA